MCKALLMAMSKSLFLGCFALQKDNPAPRPGCAPSQVRSEPIPYCVLLISFAYNQTVISVLQFFGHAHLCEQYKCRQARQMCRVQAVVACLL